MQAQCSALDCQRPVMAIGLCSTHVSRMYRTGKLETSRIPAVDRFYTLINADGPIPAHRPEIGACAVWTAATDKNGYGLFKLPGKMVKAHRYAWQLAHGSITSDVLVCHHCDNPTCVRLDHLFVKEPASGICSVDDCEQASLALSLCERHYRRSRQHGTPFYTQPTVSERFWQYVDKNGPVPAHCPELGPCWLWAAAQSTDGYGHFAPTHTKQVNAHRFAWEQAHGPIPVGLFVCHRCDNRLCVRVEHLFLGTSQENTQDRVDKNRSATGARNGKYTKPESTPRGENHGRAKLTEADVRLIRQRIANHETQTAIAHDLDVSPALIGFIATGRIWKHVR